MGQPPTTCIKHSAGSVLHYRFRFLISFGVGERTQQVAKAILRHLALAPKPRYVLYTSVGGNVACDNFRFRKKKKKI